MKGGIKVELEKLYGARAVTAAAPARRASVKEDTSDAFARMLQNLRTSKAANSRDRADDEGDTVITRVLADGSVIVRVYKGTALISETMTRGSDPAAGKRIISEHVEKIHPDVPAAEADPLLATKAAQGAIGTAAALMSTMM